MIHHEVALVSLLKKENGPRRIYSFNVQHRKILGFINARHLMQSLQQLIFMFLEVVIVLILATFIMGVQILKMKMVFNISALDTNEET